MLAVASCGGEAPPAHSPAPSAQNTAVVKPRPLPEPTSECWDVARVDPSTLARDSRSALDDLENGDRLQKGNCVGSGALLPVVERYRTANREEATKQLAARGLELLWLAASAAEVPPGSALHAVLEEDGRRSIVAVAGTVFARDRCGVIHPLSIHNEARGARDRRATTCGCDSGYEVAMPVEHWWAEPKDMPRPPRNIGPMAPPFVPRFQRYELPADATVGDAISAVVYRMYRLQTQGVVPHQGSSTPAPACQPPP